MSVGEFIKGLPCHNSKNFTHFNNEVRTSQKRPSVYLPTEDTPSEQLIVMDKRCVLLRYLTQQWDKKSAPRKREHGSDGNTSVNNGNCKKRRLEPVDE